MELYSVKMRASQENEGFHRHISGAERIVPLSELERCLCELRKRAMEHDRGSADQINIKIEKVGREEIIIIPALKVSTIHVETKQEGWQAMTEVLEAAGIVSGKNLVKLLTSLSDMRGAVLWGLRQERRLEENFKRGIRATYMDYADSAKDGSCSGKAHFREALALASKVLHHPRLVAELCISDDPDYITGYVATKRHGYVRITNLKDKGSDKGGRIFVFDGTTEDVPECVAYLQKKKVLIRE